MPEASVRESGDGRLEIHGDLSFASVPPLWHRHREAFARSGALDIDLSHVGRSDSAGLALLMECLRQSSETGTSIRFFNIPAQMLAIARVSGLDRILPLHRDG